MPTIVLFYVFFYKAVLLKRRLGVVKTITIISIVAIVPKPTTNGGQAREQIVCLPNAYDVAVDVRSLGRIALAVRTD